MYSRGSGGYGQQSYSGQSSYAQSLANAYNASSAGGADSSSQHSLASRHPSLLSGTQEADLAGYRSHSSVSGHYGGQYASIYGSAGGVSATPQVPSASSKGSVPSGLEARRGGYSSAVSNSPKFASENYVPSSTHGYGHKSDQLYGDKINDYTGMDRRQYSEQSSYIGRDLQSDPASRYADPVGLTHQRQTDRYERLDQPSILRQEQLLKSQSIQSSSLDGGARPIDYLAARGGGASRHLNQDLAPYGGRGDPEPRGSSILNAASYNPTHASSILGAAPRRGVDDLIYSQSVTNPGYGVSLPPGRDYGSGKSLQGTSLDAEYRALHPRIDDRRDERAGYLREFDLREDERRREFFREREKEREKEREREREKQRDRDHHERERERRRDRERMMERRDKERERKRAIETRRERTPPRLLRDPRGSSVTKEGRSVRRDSMSLDASHRRHSPVKDKRREYICKVHGSCLVDTERDYLSLDRRYPRLFVSPELSKVVVNWPKENFKLSIHTPVSFEHDFVEEENALESKGLSSNLLGHPLSQPENGRTVWNAKIILMSGVSKNAFEALSSPGKISDDRPPHICNILRFAVLKMDRAFMTIGGPWDPVDGGDPSVDDTPLIQTALRYAKNITQLDLQNCRHWNRFLEIHYNRVGKDGLFSHKEVTVLFVPDLSECLPSLESWRNQWLAHKKAVAERERQLSLKKERSGEKKEGSKDKGSDSSKDSKQVTKPEKTKTPASSSANKKENASKEKTVSPKDAENKKSVEGNITEKDVPKEELAEPSSNTPTASGVKTGKKKIVKRIVKKKAVAKPSGPASSTNNLSSEKDIAEKPAESEDKGLEPEAKGEVTPQPVENKPMDKPEPGSGSAASVKTAVKKKIIKRVLKRKLTTNKEATDGTAAVIVKEEKKEPEDSGNQVVDGENDNKVKEAKDKVVTPMIKSPEKQAGLAKGSKTESKVATDDKEEKKPGNGKGDKQKVAEKDNNHAVKKEASVDGVKAIKTEKKDKNGKDQQQPRSRSPKEVKEKKKPEEPPRHPGLILQTKCDKKTMLYSLSLSLDSLLDYTDKDTDESTIELSLFAESLHEMLQYQMGSRLLEFLQKLRVKFVAKRNQKKRQLEEKDAKEKVEKSSAKRLKTSEVPAKKEESDAEKLNANNRDDPKTTKEEALVKNEVNPENDLDDEDPDEDPDQDPDEDPDQDPDEDPDQDPDEDPDQDPDEDPDQDPDEDPDPEGDAKMEDAEQNVASEKDKEEVVKAICGGGSNGAAVAVNEAGKDSEMKDAESKGKGEPQSEKVDSEGEKKKKESSAVKEPVVDKELLQAFRFFDRNQAGFIRVEDMRLIIHTLGKFLSHRDVKELVQSALLESNTGRDDRILYNKLVKMNL